LPVLERYCESSLNYLCSTTGLLVIAGLLGFAGWRRMRAGSG
jgi:hypothetical protein